MAETIKFICVKECFHRHRKWKKGDPIDARPEECWTLVGNKGNKRPYKEGDEPDTLILPHFRRPKASDMLPIEDEDDTKTLSQAGKDGDFLS